MGNLGLSGESVRGRGGQLPGAVNTVVRMPKRGACRGAGRLEWSQRDRLMYNVRRATAPEQGADPPRESRAQQVYTGRVCTILNCPTMQNSTCVWGALYNLHAAPHNASPRTESFGLRAVTGRRAGSAKQNPHQWYQRRLPVWKKMCSGVQILDQVLVCSRCAVKATYQEHSVI